MALLRFAQVSLVAIATLAVACGGSEPSTSESQTDSTPGLTETDDPSQPPVTLTAQSLLPEASALGQLASWFYDEVEARTAGAVTFERFWDGSLVEAVDIRNGLEDGRLDVGQSSHAYQAAAFPLTGITDIPYATDNVPALTRAVTSLYHESPAMRDEWEAQGLRLVSFLAVPPSVLGSTEAIEGIDDLVNRQVRVGAADRFTPAVEAVGGNPVSLTVFEVYESVERGVVSAFLSVPLDLVAPLSLHEVAPYITDTGMGLYSGTYLAMSLATWNELMPGTQQIIDEVAAEIPSRIGEYFAAGEEAACEAIGQAGGTVTLLPEDEIDAWEDAIGTTVLDRWSQGAEDAGVDADEFFSQYEAELASASAEHPDYENPIHKCASSLADQ